MDFCTNIGLINIGFNITCDNYFTSLKLAQELIKIKTSLCGTVRQNRRELPEETMKKQELHASKILRHNNSGVTLTIYQCKPAKSVMMLSSLHKDVQVLI